MKRGSQWVCVVAAIAFAVTGCGIPTEVTIGAPAPTPPRSPAVAAAEALLTAKSGSLVADGEVHLVTTEVEGDDRWVVRTESRVGLDLYGRSDDPQFCWYLNSETPEPVEVKWSGSYCQYPDEIYLKMDIYEWNALAEASDAEIRSLVAAVEKEPDSALAAATSWAQDRDGFRYLFEAVAQTTPQPGVTIFEVKQESRPRSLKFENPTTFAATFTVTAEGTVEMTEVWTAWDY